MKDSIVAAKLAELRKERKLTQAEVAQALSISDKVISKWENGGSNPDLGALVSLSRFYGVSTDELLGMEEPKDESVDAQIRAAFEGLDCDQAIIRAFEVAQAMYGPLWETITFPERVCAKRGVAQNPQETFRTDTEGIVSGNAGDDTPFAEEKTTGKDWPEEAAKLPDHSPVIPDGMPVPHDAHRCCVSNENFYSFFAAGDSMNLSAMLFRNREDFAWMRDPGVQEKIGGFFRFLSDPDALSICWFLHSKACSEAFTVEYIVKNTGVEREKAEKILDDSVVYGLCEKLSAQLTSGEATIYESFGAGNLLFLVSLAYEHLCGETNYYYHNEKNCKMIGR